MEIHFQVITTNASGVLDYADASIYKTRAAAEAKIERYRANTQNPELWETARVQIVYLERE